MRLRPSRRALFITAVTAFVLLTTAWLDARAQEAERWSTPLPPLWWPFSPDPRPGPEAGLRRTYFNRPAPDFTLPDLRTGRPVTLSASRGRPTVLIFGSFTCTLFCSQAADLRRLHREYGDRAQFLFVSIQEAWHPNPELAAYLRHLPGPPDTARAGIDLYGFRFPCLDGSARRSVERAYEAYPERLLVLDPDGHVFWDSLPGRLVSERLRLGEAEQQLRACLAGDRPEGSS